MKPTVVVTRKLFDAHVEQLRREYEVIDNQKDLGLAPEALRERLAQADAALIAGGGERVDAPLLAACPKLKIVANVAVGYNNFDLDACTAAGVLRHQHPRRAQRGRCRPHVGAAAGGGAARRRIGTLAARRTVEALDLRRGFLGNQLAGSTLGILGMGRIGRAIAHRATGFSMRVLLSQPLAPGASARGRGAEYVDKADAARASRTR